MKEKSTHHFPCCEYSVWSKALWIYPRWHCRARNSAQGGRMDQRGGEGSMEGVIWIQISISYQNYIISKTFWWQKRPSCEWEWAPYWWKNHTEAAGTHVVHIEDWIPAQVEIILSWHLTNEADSGVTLLLSINHVVVLLFNDCLLVGVCSGHWLVS